MPTPTGKSTRAERQAQPVVQQMLGHSSATMTLDTYGHLFPDRLDEVADAMDAHRVRIAARASEKPTAPASVH